MVSSTAIPPGPRDLLLRLGPALDVTACVPITRAARRLRTGAVDRVVLDLAQTRHLRDFGLALLVLLHAHGGAAAERVVLLHCSGVVRRRIEEAGMYDHFHFPRPRPRPAPAASIRSATPRRRGGTRRAPWVARPAPAPPPAPVRPAALGHVPE